MRLFNENLGHRLWGMALVLWMIGIVDLNLFLWARILSAILMIYFISFGASRFTPEYRKIF